METGKTQKRFETSPHLLLPLDKKGRAYTLFQKVQGAMLNVPDFGETCKAILDAVMDEMDAENCSLMLKDPVSGDLTIRAARGKNERKSIYYSEESGNGKRFKSGEGIAGWVLKEGQAVMVNDVNQEPHFVEVAGLKNGVSSLSVFQSEIKTRSWESSTSVIPRGVPLMKEISWL